MEQVMGQAKPATDIYALGMSLVLATTGKSPTELPVNPQTGRVEIEQAMAGIAPDRIRILEGMIEPIIGARLSSADAVFKALSRDVDPRTDNNPSTTSPPQGDVLLQGDDLRRVNALLQRKEKAQQTIRTRMRLLGILFLLMSTLAAVYQVHQADQNKALQTWNNYYRVSPSIEMRWAEPTIQYSNTNDTFDPKAIGTHDSVPEATTSKGGDASLTASEIKAVFAFLSPDIIASCINAAASADINVDITISAQGDVQRADATGNDPAAAKCMKDSMQHWKFRSSGGTTRTRATVPFHFVRR